MNKDKDAIKNGDFPSLTAFLMEMGYIKYVSKLEYKMLEIDYLTENTPESSSSITIETDNTGGYYLMKWQFIMWMNENQLSWFSKM